MTNFPYYNWKLKPLLPQNRFKAIKINSYNGKIAENLVFPLSDPHTLAVYLRGLGRNIAMNTIHCNKNQEITLLV